jgi:hypothetical protein
MIFNQTNFIEADWKAERLAVRNSFWWPEAPKSWNKQGPSVFTQIYLCFSAAEDFFSAMFD